MEKGEFIVAVVSLCAGLGGKLLSDTYTSVMNKKWTPSLINEYVSASVSSVTTLTYGPKVGNIASTVTSSAIDYGYEYVTSEKKHHLQKL